MPRSHSRSPSPYSRRASYRKEDSRRYSESRSPSPKRRRRSHSRDSHRSRSPDRADRLRDRSRSSSYERARPQRRRSPSTDRFQSNRMDIDSRDAPPPRKKIATGFKWKEKPTTNTSSSTSIRDNRYEDGEKVGRGYKERSEKDRQRERDRYRERENERERDRDRDDYRERGSRRDRGGESHRRVPRPRSSSAGPRGAPPSKDKIDDQTVQANEDQDVDERVRAKFGDVKLKPKTIQPTSNGGSIEDKFGGSFASSNNLTKGTPVTGNGDNETGKEKRKKEKSSKSKIAQTDEPFIVVNVNDRLGTKAAIKCFASDPIRLFKAVVAAQIGRQPHEIMLKRQGERPFKDGLTLEDYGVSNGVQLDLEVDTGD